ncbi:D-cysteine desulfhydrase [Anaerobacillus isosaccharinicus]|uniref:D-cysteine desulfhydrase n=1 Tax=Anaerobacillus isosaccharinicus TaxID=1532552 RepID=A0A1S2LI60_9BACI|nr:D-cysteine desulfhydrase [Anaerobacillus isosaccharinicus]MBA5586605.1 D-cysteine desulfhydrase [Anaerobacillus isosaccharinicus]QOY35160.1 D-cysteine desulfhydrase [Anaerobacillus isosaccharinicus]
MNLTKFPRIRYTHSPTPIEEASRFSEALGGPTISIKRDDLLGLTEGGNKTRKLEFLIADAKAKGADTIITAGGIQSNHCRLTLAACVKANLNCILVLEENAINQYDTQTNGNFLLYQLLGTEAIKIVANGTDVYAEMDQVANEVKEEGRTPYLIPIGGSNVIGATGYAACAKEIVDQGEDFDYVICASGSGGMHGGLLAGFLGLEKKTEVIGMNVSRAKQEQEEKVYELTKATALHLGIEKSIPREKILCFDEYVGPGYALPTLGMVEAVKLLASTEAILLDPVYTGKTMAGLIDLIRKGYFKQSDKILFLHSGGTPAIYAYSPIFYEK